MYNDTLAYVESSNLDCYMTHVRQTEHRDFNFKLNVICMLPYFVYATF